MTIHDHINNFLRDAQYKVATLSSDIDQLEDNGSYDYLEKVKCRRELLTFMDILYEGSWYILDGYNHIQYSEEAGTDDSWTEREVVQEIQYLRYYCNMNEMPFINFTAHYPQIFAGGTSSGVSFPPGNPGDFVSYNALSQPYAEQFDLYGGCKDSDTINSYFSGRP